MKLELTIQISVRQPHYSGGAIELRDSFQIPAADFMQLCKILAQFDELSKKIKADQ
jgi:hypothetical protein